MAISLRSKVKNTDQLTLFQAAHPVRISASPDSARDWAANVVNLRSNMVAWLAEHAPAGWFGRTSPMCSALTTVEISELSSPASPDIQPGPFSSLPPTGGKMPGSSPAQIPTVTGSLGECWTLSLPEFHSAAVACSLSDILEIGDVPPRFFLSAKACSGILRRSVKRAKTLLPQLQAALQTVAQPTGHDPDTAKRA
jgi:hypothetical protein